MELTALGEGTEDSARRVPKARILSLPGQDADAVLQILTDERLVTVGDADDREGVSIAHEALIREWGSLRRWVDGRRQDIRFQREVEQAEEAWRKAGGERDQLLRGARLKQAIQWKQRNAGELRPEIEEFVEASRRRGRRDRVLRWGSVVFVMGLLFLLALQTLPTIQSGLHWVQRSLATGRVNPKDGRSGSTRPGRATQPSATARVKKLHQESESNYKPEYIFGHSCQAVAVLTQALSSVFALPLDRKSVV